MNAAKAVSATKQSTNSGCLILFGMVFLFFGVTFFYFVTLKPLFRSVSTSNWQETQAKITKSEVIEDNSADGTTYEPEIHFDYVADDQLLRSESWSTGFSGGSRRNRSLAVVEKYPVGSKHTCYFDPDDPRDAVLDRSFQWSNSLGSFALIFAGIGGGMVWYFFHARSNEKKMQTARHPSPDAGSVSLQDCPWQNLAGPQKLRSAQGRITTFFVTLVVSLFWNCFSWVIFFHAWNDGEKLAMAFMSVFGLVGMVLIFACIYSFLKIFNPVIEVALSNGAPQPGETLDLAWESSGHVRSLRELKLSIIGEEVVTYVRGTTTSTERKVFQRLPLVNVATESEMRFGTVSVELPSTMIHSFEAPNNKIVWSVEVHGSVPWWPDVHETRPFAIRPQTTSEQTKALT